MHLALLHCSIILASSLNHILHCNCGPGSKTPLINSIQSLGIILLQTNYDLNICYIKGECMPYETIVFLTILKSNIGTGIQLTVTESLPLENFCKVTGYIKVGKKRKPSWVDLESHLQLWWEPHVQLWQKPRLQLQSVPVAFSRIHTPNSGCQM